MRPYTQYLSKKARMQHQMSKKDHSSQNRSRNVETHMACNMHGNLKVLSAYRICNRSDCNSNVCSILVTDLHLHNHAIIVECFVDGIVARKQEVLTQLQQVCPSPGQLFTTESCTWHNMVPFLVCRLKKTVDNSTGKPTCRSELTLLPALNCRRTRTEARTTRNKALFLIRLLQLPCQAHT